MEQAHLLGGGEPLVGSALRELAVQALELWLQLQPEGNLQDGGEALVWLRLLELLPAAGQW